MCDTVVKSLLPDTYGLLLNINVLFMIAQIADEKKTVSKILMAVCYHYQEKL